MQPFTGIFNDSFPPIIDGVSLAVQNYARWLSAAGQRPCIVTPSNPIAEERPYPVIRYFSLPIANRKPYRYGYPKLDFKIWRRLRETPMRLVHCHCPFSSGRLGAYAARKQRVPLIATFHSKFRNDLEHSFEKTPWMVNIIMRRILDFFNVCDHVWIPQAAVEETVREYGFRGKLTVVENGNDLASLYSPDDLPMVKLSARRAFSIPNDAISLLFVGQHILEKGIIVIAKTLRILMGQGIDFRMNFIGQGYALPQLEQFIKENGLEDKCTIHGVVTERDQLAKHYAAADVFLFPSFYDNAPLVIREAAAMGTPSILPVGSTASEVICDGVNGMLTGATPEQYAAMVKQLTENRDVCAALGMKARETLTRSWDNVMEEVSQRYSDIIERYNHEHRNS